MCSGLWSWVYPRGCGGTCPPLRRPLGRPGLSPRVRGNLPGGAGDAAGGRSIPAGAGEPPPSPPPPARCRVYPRGCEGTAVSPGTSTASRGLSRGCGGTGSSPMTVSRGFFLQKVGQGVGWLHGQTLGREIGEAPASTQHYTHMIDGRVNMLFASDDVKEFYERERFLRDSDKSMVGIRVLDVTPAIPFVGGGVSSSARIAARIAAVTGRVVRPLASGARTSLASGLKLPAYFMAGAVTTPTRTPTIPNIPNFPFTPPGLSPRVRRNPLLLRLDSGRCRSIPAGAGEPVDASSRRKVEWVYPRGCGGTISGTAQTFTATGLSPRVRGNQGRGEGLRPSLWSIPAGAGEPSCRRMRTGTGGVYPRGCGGTALTAPHHILDTGLSPRVRGNLSSRSSTRQVERSIPAGAGEPRRSPAARRRAWVYPRGCGGTRHTCLLVTRPSGLSPRVRGNHADPRVAHEVIRSIPAGAGEPGVLALP